MNWMSVPTLSMLLTSSSATLRTEASGILGSVLGLARPPTSSAMKRKLSGGMTMWACESMIMKEALSSQWLSGLSEDGHHLELQPHAVLQRVHRDVARRAVVGIGKRGQPLGV